MRGTAEFPEAFTEEEEEAAAPMPRQLRAVVPQAASGDLEQLQQESSRHRVLLLRGGAVIAVTTVISIGGALFIHAIFAGIIVLGVWFPWLAPARGNNASPGPADKGGASGGFTILGSGPDDNAAPSLTPASLLGQHGPISPPADATLPPLPEVTSAQIASQLATPELLLPAINSDMGNVIITPAPEPIAAPAALLVAPPSAPAPSIAPSNASLAGTTGAPARGTTSGDGGGEDDHVFGLLKGDGSNNWGAGGSGKGKGSGNGDGIDRGMSAADRDPALLNLTPGAAMEFTIPLKYQLKPPPKSVRLVITILPDGKVGNIKLAQSCGVPDIDQLVLAYAANFQF
ncbi:MAG TPA: energy transducer TonB, partial [Phycisphaerae bacterium]